MKTNKEYLEGEVIKEFLTPPPTSDIVEEETTKFEVFFDRLCVCIPAYKDRQLIDPQCQSCHEIDRVTEYYKASLIRAMEKAVEENHKHCWNNQEKLNADHSDCEDCCICNKSFVEMKKRSEV